MQHIVNISDLSKKFGGLYALKNISFNVKKNELFGCFGPNGAGKTTLIKILTGQLRATSGQIDVLGVNPEKQPVVVKKNIGIMPESDSPPSFLTGWEFLYFVGHIRKLKNVKERIEHWLDFFDMGDKKDSLCKDMSKGMKQKMMLSAAFIHEPDLLILDEPLINLDPIYQRKVKNYLKEYVKKRTVFMCTHILDAAEELCNNTVILNRGEIVGRGRIAHLRAEKDEKLEDIFLRLVE